MRRRAVLALLVLGLVLPAPVAAAPDPLTCTGYPEARVFLEDQAWWGQNGLDIPADVGEHIHVGACWPVYSVNIGSSLHVDLRILLHNMAEDRITLGRFRVNWRKVGSNGVAIESAGGLLIDESPGPTITRDSSGNGSAIIPVDLNLSRLPKATVEIRFNPFAYPDNDTREMLAATGWQIRHGASTTSTPHIVGKGWYALDHNYQNAVFKSSVPTSPVHGTYCITAGMNPGGGGMPTVLSIATWDPDYHNGYGGMEVLRRAGSFSGKVCTDTTRLTNGLHKLVLLAEDGNLAGVAVVPIPVAN